MPLTPQGTYPRPVERIGTPTGLQVRPNPPKDKRFQELRLTPQRPPAWAKSATRAEDFYEMLQGVMAERPVESTLVMPCNTKNKPTALVEISRGTLDSSIVHPRDVFMAAIAANAATVVFLHNHPSGDPEPSPEDIAVTRRLADAGQILNIPLLDSIVIGANSYVSLAERGIV